MIANPQWWHKQLCAWVYGIRCVCVWGEKYVVGANIGTSWQFLLLLQLIIARRGRGIWYSFRGVFG